MVKALWIAPLVALALAQPSVQDKAKKDLELLQGTWVIEAMEINGKPIPVDKLQGTVLVIKGTEYRTKIKDKMLFPFQLKLDPSQDPRAVDMILSQPGEVDKVHKGIYVIEKDTFKLCRGLNPEQERPNQFATWPDTNVFVVTWKKQGK